MFRHWRLVEQDLFDAGVDVEDDDLMTSRSWRWLTVRITGLLNHPTTRTRIAAELARGGTDDA